MKLTLDGVWAYYDEIPALKGVSVHLESGEAVAMIGPNGAGKTTLLRTISGLVKARKGTIRLGDINLAGLAPDAAARAGVVHVPEGRQIFAPFTVRENLYMGFMARGRRSGDRKTALAHVLDLFPELEPIQSQVAGTLSGGQQQMVAIGRALMADPQVLMLDEPSLGLAPKVVARIFQALRRLRDEGRTILIVEQNVPLALDFASRAYVIEVGRVVMADTSQKLLADDRVREIYLGVGKVAAAG